MKYKCKHCGRTFDERCAHNCNTGFRKRHLEWVEVEDYEHENFRRNKSSKTCKE